MLFEAIIGREHGTNRLIMRVNNQAYAISSPHGVPKTVSSNHCRLQVDDNRAMTLSNINSQLNTYVDGLQINSKHITFESRVELGLDHFPIDMGAVKRVVDKIFPPPPQQYSIAHLEQIWDWYQETSRELIVKENKLNSIRNLQGVFMTVGVMMMILPQLLNTEIPYINVLRFVLGLPAIIIPFYFFIRSFDDSKQITVKLDELKKEFESKYVCPNPQCRRFMGYIPYNQLKYTQRCINPACGCHYTNA